MGRRAAGTMLATGARARPNQMSANAARRHRRHSHTTRAASSSMALNDSNTIDVPDFRREEDREAYEDDHWRPDPVNGDPWPSIFGKQEPTEAQLTFSREAWRQKGYEGE